MSLASEVQAFSLPTLEPDGGLVLAGGVTPVARAAEIVQQAHTDAAQIRAEAAAEGRTAGLAEGVAQAEHELGPAVQALSAAVAALDAQESAIVERAEQRAVELALAIADKILAVSLDVRPELVLELVTGVLRSASTSDRLLVEINPDDYDLIVSAAGNVPALGRAEIVAERRVERGGCIVRTDEGEIDGRIAEQLARASEALRSAVTPGGDD